jgi:hypothetical protein
MGFIKAKIIAPKKLYYPILPFIPKESSKTLFPLGKWVGTYFSEELLYAESLGYIVQPICGYLFDRDNIYPFKRFVLSLYDMRVNAAKDNNIILKTIIKYILNTLYGKLAFSNNKNRTYIVKNTQLEEFIAKKEVVYIEEITDMSEFSKVSLPAAFDEETPLVSVACAAAITSYAILYNLHA